MKIPAEYLEQV